MVSNTDLCVVKLRSDERISKTLADLLDPIDMMSMHEYTLPPRSDVELHYHDFDEYWLFNEGQATVTLNLPVGTTKAYHLKPGDLVATVRGVAHTLCADHTLRYTQWNGMIRPDARTGHLLRVKDKGRKMNL